MAPNADRTPVRALLALSLTAALTLAAPAPAATISTRDRLEADLVQRINVVRRQHGVRALRVVPGLSGAAARHSVSMARVGYFSHSLLTATRAHEWTAFGRWVRWFYPGPGFTEWTAGENLAWGAPGLSPRRTVRRWLKSAGHRANLLDPRWRHLGVSAVHVRRPGGYFAAWDDVTIVAAEFGRRR